MKDWWQQLNSREQRFVSAGGIISFILLFYLLIWSPFTSSLDNLKSTVVSQSNLLNWMLPAQQQLLQLRSSGKKVTPISSDNLLTTIDSSMQQESLSHYSNGIQQIGSNRLLIKFNSVPFNSLIAWLSELWEKYHIKVSTITISPIGNHSGLVSSSLSLTGIS